MQSLSPAQLRTIRGGTDPIFGPDATEPGGILSGTTIFLPDPPDFPDHTGNH